MSRILFSIFFLSSFCVFGQESKVLTTNEIETYPWFEDLSTGGFDLGTAECFKNQMDLHITKYFQYPIDALKKRLTGKAYVQFVIDSLGTVSNIKARGTDESFEEEAIRIIKKIPLLNPATVNEKKVAVYYNVPIAFNLVLDGKSLSKRKELFIDLEDENSTDKLISYDQVAEPPVYVGCEDAKDVAKCFKSQFDEDLMKFITRQNSQILKIDVKVYFEIKAENKISDLLVITDNPSLKKIVENFFKVPSKIKSPSKNSNGENINSFFNTELKLIGVQRQRKTVRN